MFGKNAQAVQLQNHNSHAVHSKFANTMESKSPNILDDDI